MPRVRNHSNQGRSDSLSMEAAGPSAAFKGHHNLLLHPGNNRATTSASSHTIIMATVYDSRRSTLPPLVSMTPLHGIHVGLPLRRRYSTYTADLDDSWRMLQHNNFRRKSTGIRHLRKWTTTRIHIASGGTLGRSTGPARSAPWLHFLQNIRNKPIYLSALVQLLTPLNLERSSSSNLVKVYGLAIA